MGQAKTKNKGTRKLEEINAEYSMLCGQLGNFTFRKDVLDVEIGRIKSRLMELDIEAGACKQKMEAKAAEDAANAPEATA